ncbi:MAG TPA: PepSY-associated TM helix domain-containing protein [Terriglobales bacterium]|jgi:uncharacterized iron-regulated membrane protein|nr:PepSY-associated TM helix domain-containing protein [Terriglobales bacterium]
MRKLLLNLHLWAGLTAALFLFLLGVSGALVAFEGEIDRALNAKLSYVHPEGQPLSLDAITARLLAANPGAKIEEFGLPQRADFSLFVGLKDASGKNLALFMNPYTGEVLGSDDQANHFANKVHQFHTHLLVGEIADEITGWSSVFLLVLSITGIVLWWPRKLFRLSWDFLRGEGSLKRFNYDLHNLVGVASSIFLFIFAWTGICIHWEREVGKLAQQLSSTPAVRPVSPEIPASGSVPLSPDRIVQIAHNTLPEARITGIQLPESPKQAITIGLKFPEDHTPAGRSRIRIDAYSGKVLQVQSSRDMSAAVKYARIWNRELHTGDIFNLPMRILAAFFSLMLPILAITGPLIWWNRRKASQMAGPASAAAPLKVDVGAGAS